MKNKLQVTMLYLLGQIDAKFFRFKQIADAIILEENENWIPESKKVIEELIVLLEAWRDME